MSEEDTSNLRVIAGFWRRLAAFIIDLLLLVAVGILLGVFFGEEFARIGPWGRLIGFAIAISYFGILNSKISGGKTIGNLSDKV